MSPVLIVSRDAKIEIVDVSDWYDLREAGTGERFMAAVERKFDEICGHPHIYPAMKGSEIRKCRLERWPYFIYYAMGESKIEVIVIIHTSRDPAYISSRLR